MAIACKNCGGHFSTDELSRRRPPQHPWPLTAVGQRVLAENQVAGDSQPCPACGQKTLRA